MIALAQYALRMAPVTLLGGAAFFSAQGIGQIVGMSLLTSSALVEASAYAGTPTGPSLADAHAEEHARRADAILGRNPFDSARGALTPAPVGAADSEVASAPGDPRLAPACQGIRVTALASSLDVGWSMAALAEGADPRPVLRRRGGVLGAYRVEYVGSDRVWLTREGALCQVEMFHQPPPGAPSASATTIASARVNEGAAPPPNPILKGIVRVSATEVQVDRATRDRILEEAATLMAQVRAVPDLGPDGRAMGYRLAGIRPGSVLAAMNLESGDSLRSVNGYELTNPEVLLEAYARLRTAEKLSLHIVRRGAPMTLDAIVR